MNDNWEKRAREHRLEYFRQWRAKNKGYNNKYVKKWRVENVPCYLVDLAKRRSIRKNIPFNLDGEWIDKHWTGRCELTNIPFIIGLGTSKKTVYSPSIDRIKPELGYTKGNCRFVLWGVNAFKGVGTDKDMYKIANALIDERKKK